MLSHPKCASSFRMDRRQDKLANNLVTSFMDGFKTMGEYQRVNVEAQSAAHLATIENRINGSINEVLEQVVDLKDQLPGLPAPDVEPGLRLE